MRDMFDLTGKVAVVTGATKGIGRAIAHALAAHGAKVAISSRKADSCDRVMAEIREAGGEAVYLREPLQRAVRDGQVAATHAMVAPRIRELTGRLALGLDTDVTLL